MSPSSKTEQDLALVREIIGVDPLDFARWIGGELAIILPDGRKLLLKDEQISQALRTGQYNIKAGAVPAPAADRAKMHPFNVDFRFKNLA